MTGPYVGVDIASLPQATLLTGSELIAVVQSGQTRKTNALSVAAGPSQGGTVTQVVTGTGLTGGPITASGTVQFSNITPSAFWANVSTATAQPVITTLGVGLAFSGMTLINTLSGGGGGGSGSVTQILTGTGLTGGPITASGTVSFAAIAADSLWANPTTASAVPQITTLGAGLAFSGTTIINTSGGISTAVTSILFQSGLSGATITNTGTVGINNLGITTAMLAANAVTYAKIQQASSNILLGNPTTTGNVEEITLAGNLAFSGTTLTTTNLATGTVTQVSTGTGLQGGPVTNSGTISFANIAPLAFWANVSTATTQPVVTTLGVGLAFSGTTIVNTSGAATTGTVTQISTGTGLTGGPVTSSGTISFVSIAPTSLWANVSTATAIPVITTLGVGLGFSGTTIINTSGATTTGTVTSIIFQSGLSGGTITNTGTVGINNLGVTTAMLAANAATYAKLQQASSNILLGNPTVTGNLSEITLGGGLGFSGTTLVNLSGAPDGVLQISTGTGLTGGPVTSSGTILFAQIAPSSLWANVSTATTTPVITTLGPGLAFSGATIINTSGAGGGGTGITSILFQSGLSGGTITSTGTVGISNLGVTTAMLAANAVTYAKIQQASSTVLIGNATVTGNVEEITLAGNLAFSGTTLTTTNLTTGTVTQVQTGTGLTGGTITNTGSISFAAIAAKSFWANVSTATTTPVITTLAGNLAFSGTTLTTTNLNAGTVTQISTGTGLTGGPVTSSGTILFATIAANSLWVNVSTATATPVVAGFGSGLAVSGSNIVNTFNSSVAGITIDGGGVVFTTGGAGYVQIPYNCTISSWTMLGNLTGSATVDIQRATYTGFPTFTSMVGAGNLPTLAAAQKNSAAPATWSSVTISASDILLFSVSTVSALTRLNLQLNLVRF